MGGQDVETEGPGQVCDDCPVHGLDGGGGLGDGGVGGGDHE